MRAELYNDDTNIDENRPKQQPSELSQKASTVEKFVEQGLTSRRPYERQWYLNMAYFMGKQWVTWNTVTRRLHVILDPKVRKRVTVNRVMPAIMKEIGRMTKAKPKYFVVPEEPTEESKQIARMADDLLDYWRRELSLNIKNHQLLKYMCIFGTAYKDIYWDTTKGETVVSDETGEQIRIGDLDQEPLSPFHVVKEPGATRLKDSNKVCITKRRNVEWVKRHYPEWGYLVKSGVDESGALSSIEKQLNSLMQTEEAESSDDTGKDTGFVNVKEYRELPCEKHPEGRVIVTCNKILLAEGKLPLEWQRSERHLGLLEYFFVEIPDRPYGRSYIEDLIPVQREYNKTLSQLIEHRNSCKAKFLKATGHNLKINPNNEVGQIIEYTAIPGAGEPHWLTPPPVPAYMKDLIELNKMDIRDITSQHEVCVDEKVQCLTQRGWKRHNEICDDDMVYTYNLKTKKAEWNILQGVNTYDINKEVYDVRNSDWQIYCTKKHKWLAINSYGTVKLDTIEDFGNDWSIPKVAEYAEKDKENKINSDMASFLGWYITEGNISYNDNAIIRISQSNTYNHAHCASIRKLLQRLKLNFRENRQKDGCIHFTITNHRDPGFVSSVEKICPEKSLTLDIINLLSQKAKHSLFKALIDGDGCYDVSTGAMSFATTDRETADNFQILSTLIGKATTLTEEDREKRKNIFIIRVLKGKKISIQKLKVKKVIYDGIVWCPTTKNKTWFARKDGKTFFTGNSQGSTPPGVSANVAIETLVEMDSTQFSPTHERYTQIEAEAGMLMLKTAKEKYNETRKIEFIGEEDQVQVKYFDQADRLPTKIIVQRGSSIGELKTVQQQKILELIDRGIIDREDRKEVFKMLEFGGIDEKIKDENADQQRAVLENARIDTDMPIRVQHFDDHEVHIQVHNDKFRKTHKYEQLPQEQKEKIDTHVRIHGGALGGALRQDPQTGQWEMIPPEERVPPPEMQEEGEEDANS